MDGRDRFDRISCDPDRPLVKKNTQVRESQTSNPALGRTWEANLMMADRTVASDFTLESSFLRYHSFSLNWRV